jgi:hypothetical protein
MWLVSKIQKVINLIKETHLIWNVFNFKQPVYKSEMSLAHIKIEMRN